MGPEVIGTDIEFLLDTPAGYTVMSIAQIADMVEADLYGAMPTTLSESKIYVLTRNYAPRVVAYRYQAVESNCIDEQGNRYHQRKVQLIDADGGGVIAQAPYRVYPPELVVQQ